MEENLYKGYIWLSQSSMASSFFFIVKKDGRLRPCQDYHYLNKETIKNAYPLPLISKLIHNCTFLKSEKCIFEMQEVEFLGMVITPGQVHIGSVKVKGIVKWLQLMNIKEVQFFLRFGNFYWRFIHNYLDIAAPLHWLIKKMISWKWNDNFETVFQILKVLFLAKPVLQMSDLTYPFILETDTSKYGMGGKLRQQDDNRFWHPCRYLSQILVSAKVNY